MLFFLFFILSLITAHAKEDYLPSSLGNDDVDSDPALKEMSFDIGDGPETFMAYVQPDVTSFYKDVEPPASKSVTPKHNGLAGMFINMSKEPVRLYWEPHIDGERSLIEIQEPFSVGGTATFPSHLFFYTSHRDESEILIRFKVEPYPNNVYIFDPYHVEADLGETEKNLLQLDEIEREKYIKIRKSYLFGEVYKSFTGRSYLVNYPRPPPKHHMWRADYFNQTHWATTRETHFLSMPSREKLSDLRTHGKSRVIDERKPRPLVDYRSDQPLMNMTLKVLSCAPRVFEIKEFLSPIEVEHMLYLASGEDLSLSLTGQGETSSTGEIKKTRTSRNSWLERERSPILDAIYRRAADLLRVNEALLRYRGDGEFPDLGSEKSLAEHLQLVHYTKKQEYQAHHDFGFNDIDDPFQAQRFATILLYLNEGMKGGATTFPRWVNAETFEQLKVKPETGKAVLFYSQLPDGNMDDFSQHEAQKIFGGEKWLTNLWLWSPVYN
mmetsp:Transcript_34107/g.38814  ORF Transcript_34107/g.38814 Transcript_34107/m.38814 type:complete len:495 (-) Transcript_34107:113-1597(-)